MKRKYWPLQILNIYSSGTAKKIIEYNGFLLHGVVAEVNNCGIVFLARSGVGKSTHASLWKELLKDKIRGIYIGSKNEEKELNLKDDI